MKVGHGATSFLLTSIRCPQFKPQITPLPLPFLRKKRPFIMVGKRATLRTVGGRKGQTDVTQEETELAGGCMNSPVFMCPSPPPVPT